MGSGRPYSHYRGTTSDPRAAQETENLNEQPQKPIVLRNLRRFVLKIPAIPRVLPHKAVPEMESGATC